MNADRNADRTRFPSWYGSLGCALVIALTMSRVVSAGEGSVPLSDATPILEDFGKQAQDQTRPEAERLQVVKVLAAWGTPQVRASLLAALKDPVPSIRETAAGGLGWPGNHEAVAALIERVENPDEIAAVKAAVLESLGRIGDESSRSVVLAATRNQDKTIRQAAFESVTFGALAKSDDRIPLARQIAEDRGLDLFLRCQAIILLGRANDTGSIELLARLLQNEPPLAMPNPKEDPPPTQQQVMIVRYWEARDVRAWAAMALGMIGAKREVPLLLRTAEDPDDFFVRLTSVQVLVSWNVPEAYPVLLGRLDDSFSETRQVALVGLAKWANQGVVDAVLARLSDPSSKVRAQAVRTLGELGDPRVRPDLEALYRTEESGVVQQALVQVLGRLPR
jgi:HEAT repeat protein